LTFELKKGKTVLPQHGCQGSGKEVVPLRLHELAEIRAAAVVATPKKARPPDWEEHFLVT